MVPARRAKIVAMSTFLRPARAPAPSQFNFERSKVGAGRWPLWHRESVMPQTDDKQRQTSNQRPVAGCVSSFPRPLGAPVRCRHLAAVAAAAAYRALTAADDAGQLRRVTFCEQRYYN